MYPPFKLQAACGIGRVIYSSPPVLSHRWGNSGGNFHGGLTSPSASTVCCQPIRRVAEAVPAEMKTIVHDDWRASPRNVTATLTSWLAGSLRSNRFADGVWVNIYRWDRSEEHTSELQSPM